jgi:hypothetical protein
MDRRDALKNVALLMGGALTASTWSVMMEGCAHQVRTGKGTMFTDEEKKMVSLMADIIIPRTDTPGAADAGVPDFIVMMMQECYPDKDQQEFHDGLAAFDQFCHKQYGGSFLELSPEKQLEAVTALDKEVLSKPSSEEDKEDHDFGFYRKLKELTLLGFFTSEPGATETLRYVQVPGRYEGCVPYQEGQKAWAT